MSDRPVRVLFVCLGNICRSPLAEAAFRRKVEEAGLTERFEIGSAGTGDWHLGKGADPRTAAHALENGLDLGAHRARQLTRDDLDRWDHVLVMDRANLHDTLFLDPDGDHGTRVRLFREFDPEPETFEVPDPYYGGPEAFAHVHAVVERTAAALLARLRAAYGF